MDEVKYCSGCSRLIKPSFLFCPWCGTRVSQPWQEKVAVKEASSDLSLEKLEKFSSSLNALESDLSHFLDK